MIKSRVYTILIQPKPARTYKYCTTYTLCISSSIHVAFRHLHDYPGSKVSSVHSNIPTNSSVHEDRSTRFHHVQQVPALFSIRIGRERPLQLALLHVLDYAGQSPTVHFIRPQPSTLVRTSRFQVPSSRQ